MLKIMIRHGGAISTHEPHLSAMLSEAAISSSTGEEQQAAGLFLTDAKGMQTGTARILIVLDKHLCWLRAYKNLAMFRMMLSELTSLSLVLLPSTSRSGVKSSKWIYFVSRAMDTGHLVLSCTATSQGLLIFYTGRRSFRGLTHPEACLTHAKLDLRHEVETQQGLQRSFKYCPSTSNKAPIHVGWHAGRTI